MRKIRNTILKRIIGILPMLLVISFLSFGLMYLSPGDPAEMILSAQGTVVTPEVLQSKRVQMGLDKPFLIQYVNWIINILQGDMGVSYSTGRKVITELNEHIPYTLLLAAVSMSLTLIISIPLGFITAVKKDKYIDYFIRVLTYIGNSIPNFLAALVLLLIFSFKLKIFPVLSESGIKSVILPSVTLAIPMTSRYICQIRVCVIEEMKKDYVRGAISRGIKKNTILYKDILKNVMITIITLTGISLGSLIGGTAIVEAIFMWPGLGKLLLDSVNNRDYILIQGYVLWMGTMLVIINLITDCIYMVLDPRVKE